MILDRLRVRGKLNLLLLLPLAAVVLVAVPFVAVQIDNARAAVATADAARKARLLGALVWELQRERLITAGYLASDSVDSVDLVLAQEAVDDTAEALRSRSGPTPPTNWWRRWPGSARWRSCVRVRCSAGCHWTASRGRTTRSSRR